MDRAAGAVIASALAPSDFFKEVKRMNDPHESATSQPVQEGLPASEAHSPSHRLQNPVDPDLLARQQAVLLYQLADEPEHKLSMGQANRRLTLATKKLLALSNEVAEQRRAELVQQGLLKTSTEGRTLFYELTEKGREHVRTLPRPESPSGRTQAEAIDESTIPETLRREQRAYLLLQLFLARGRQLTQKEANDGLTNRVLRALGLNKALANRRREGLVEQGLVRLAQTEQGQEYQLTADGIDYLVASEQNEEFELKLTGGQLNSLLTAVRESQLRTPAGQGGRAPGPQVAPTTAGPAPEQLADAILEEFQNLRRDPDGPAAQGRVPIHELRRRIAARFGPQSARHEVLDEQIRQLGRQGRLRLVPVRDPDAVSEQQLRDSIPGPDSGTLFYLEDARERLVAP
jgi:predicted transcriptional regulator